MYVRTIGPWWNVCHLLRQSKKPSRKQSPSLPSSTESRNRSYFSFEGSLIFRYIVSKCGINDAVPTTNSWLTGSKRRNTKMKAVTVEILAAAAALRHDWAFYICIDVKIKRYACNKAHLQIRWVPGKSQAKPKIIKPITFSELVFHTYREKSRGMSVGRLKTICMPLGTRSLRISSSTISFNSV